MADRMQAKFDADPELQVHYEAAEAMFGGGSATAQYLEQAANKVKKAGLSKHIDGAAAAPIIAYSGSHYVSVNDQLRKGQMTKQQYAFMKSLNAGLDKLPAHTETTYRKATLPSDLLALYQPGHIIEERGFTSTSKNQGPWSGDTNFTIHGKSGRDIQKLSSHPSEAEVLFKSGSRFEIISRNGNHIEMREV